MTRTESICASTIGSAPSQNGLSRGVDGAEAARVLDAAVERQQHQLELVGAVVAADAVIRDDHHGFACEGAVRQPRDHALVLLLPQRGEGEALEFAAVGGAEPRAGKPEDRFAARVLFEDESVGQQRLDVGRLDFGPLRGGAPARNLFQYWNNAIDPSSFMFLLRAICRLCAIGEQKGAPR